MKDTDAALIDCRDLRCPLPVLKLEKAVAAARPGARLTLLATDPVARIDIPHFCAVNGHACTLEQSGPLLRFTIVVSSAD